LKEYRRTDPPQAKENAIIIQKKYFYPKKSVFPKNSLYKKWILGTHTYTILKKKKPKYFRYFTQKMDIFYNKK
jgi:hypothetical protein